MTSLKLLTTYSRYSYPMLQAVPHVFGRKIYSFGSNHIKKSQSYKERRLLGYSPENMFDIAIDVGRYSEFVPWCNHSTIIKQGENDMLARLGVGFPPLSESYMSRITFQRPKHLKVIEYSFSSACNRTDLWIVYYLLLISKLSVLEFRCTNDMFRFASQSSCS
ncbi:Coenzyme Q-binding protein COQ10A isoform 3 [Schistosoma japonicum]|uniref:Coenzyme Q-binding protein COQ10A isoform 3 n=1 Tax=Schistosoma japonicum TaxID=6182 RepID=A0A4Z2CQX2_SCHJA|nr:Coenzyme Q-binding protein COQ10 like, mitochondrial [Schistosoma japonicum]TNN06605.1 Coenzyme Q-binding protein COQ10A isoform 3 [Schistosoma japonicum]